MFILLSKEMRPAFFFFSTRAGNGLCSYKKGTRARTHTLYTLVNHAAKCFTSSIARTNERKQGCVGVSVALHYFSAAIITGLLYYYFFSLSLPPTIEKRLAELCMFVCWFHYRSRCLSWNNGEFSSVIVLNFFSLSFFFHPSRLMLRRGDDEHFGVFRLSMNEIF